MKTSTLEKMIIQRSIVTILLVSTCFQSFSMVQAMDSEEAAPYMEPFDKVASVIPEGGTNGMLAGIVPDAEKLVASMAKRDEEPTDSSQAEGTLQTSGQGVATYSDGPNEGGALEGISKDLLSQLKKRYREINAKGESELQDGTVEEHTKSLVALLNRRNGLGVSSLLGGNSNDAEMNGSGSTEGGLLSGLRRRSLGFLGSGSGSTSDKASEGGGVTEVSLLGLRRRQLVDGLFGGSSTGSAEKPNTEVSLIGKRGATVTEGNSGGSSDLGEPLDRRSTTSVLSGTERMDRARQGVVVDSHSKSDMLHRRAVYAARDYDDDQRIIEDYQKLMAERQEEYNKGLQTPSQEQVKKGTTKISLANLKRRLVKDLAEKLVLGGTTNQGSQSSGDLLSGITSTIQ